MKTIALRFADNIAPKDGTIAEHEILIERYGFVLYGKFGARVSKKTRTDILSADHKRILLIHSGTNKRYWLHIDDISYEMPKLSSIPDYYRDIARTVKTWFKVMQIEKADKSVMAKCTVSSSGSSPSAVSRHSMSPYFTIDYDEGE
ncbi:MAG: hypothetical protein K6E55_04125 [Thermoguttaceae bacterium]|nr:hypothetical protein [Thermoguttaceae bacterium]